MSENEIETLRESEIPASKISHASLMVAIGGGLSLLAGLASQVITAYLFGAGVAMDAFITAMTVPAFLQFVLVGGLPFVVIPAFVSKETSGNVDDAWSLAGTFTILITVVLMIGAVLGALFSPQIINLTAPGFGVEKSALASQMLTIMIFTIPFIGISNFTSGIQNARGRFFWPATATAVGSLGNVITLVILYPSVGPMSLAWGNLASAVLNACITSIPVFRHGWKKTLPLRDPAMVEMIKLIAPFMVFGLITHSKTLFERYFASGLPDGQLAYMGYAYKISNIFVVLFAASIASAIFPAMARAFSTQGISGLVKQSNYGMKITLALAIPSVTIISVVAIPIVKLFYERGAFDPTTTQFVSVLIPIVMIYDVFLRMVSNMVIRTYFVLKDTLTTNLIQSGAVVIYVVAAKLLTDNLGYVGLTMAQPVQLGISTLIMFIILYRRVKEFSIPNLLKSFFVYCLIGLLAAGAGWVVLSVLKDAGYFMQLIACGLVAVTVDVTLLYFVDKTIAIALLEMVGLAKIINAIKEKLTNHLKSYSFFKFKMMIARWSNHSPKFPNIFLCTAFIVALLTPILIWKGIIPDIFRWIADAALFAMFLFVPLRMLAFKNTPPAFWVIIFLSGTGMIISILKGQSVITTIWGWWLMFQYPLAGIYLYLEPKWPKEYAKWLINFLVAVLAFEVLVQLGQYATGQVPGDQLAGTFGKNGTGNLVLFLILVMCFSLGQWIQTKKWKLLIVALGLSGISSVLGEMKLFYLTVALLALIALFIYIRREKHLWRLLPAITIMILMAGIFIPIYNAIIPSTSGIELQDYLTDPTLLTKYLTFTSRSASQGTYYYDIGRNYAIQYGWEKISSDPLYLLLGYGLGARSESVSLGIAGRALLEGELGFSSGTSLLVMMQEMGLAGMIILVIFILMVVTILLHQVRQNPSSSANALRYGLVFFTLLFPLWLWYNMAWTLRVPMLIYWSTLAYVLSEFKQRDIQPLIEVAEKGKVVSAMIPGKKAYQRIMPGSNRFQRRHNT
jgi:putative peptidoglycan lipid II flippase